MHNLLLLHGKQLHPHDYTIYPRRIGGTSYHRVSFYPRGIIYNDSIIESSLTYKMQLVIIVINLHSSTKSVSEQLEQYNLDPIEVSGLDPESPIVAWYQMDASGSTIQQARFLSHLKAIKTGLRLCPTADYYLIIESCARIQDAFFTSIHEWIHQDVDVINLCRPGSSTGYLIRPDYARLACRLFDKPFRYLVSVDSITPNLILTQARTSIRIEGDLIVENTS